MLKFTKQTDYALILVRHMAGRMNQPLSAGELAAGTGVSPNMTAKILKLLSRERIVESTRGAQGGYHLARNPFQLTVAEIVTAVQGRYGLTDCIEDAEAECDVYASCTVRGTLGTLNSKIDDLLASTTIGEIAGIQRPIGIQGVAL